MNCGYNSRKFSKSNQNMQFFFTSILKAYLPAPQCVLNITSRGYLTHGFGGKVEALNQLLFCFLQRNQKPKYHSFYEVLNRLNEKLIALWINKVVEIMK